MKEIVVLQRGWVIVGDFQQEGTQCSVKNGAVVRRWGTSQGLGELAHKGPLGETVLDPLNYPARFHELTVVFRLECNPETWADVKF